MALYKRGNVWWFKFRFEGQVIRQSANTSSQTLARQAERARRRELEMAVNRIQKRERMPLFTVAAQHWLNSKSALQPKSVASYRQYVASLTSEFGQRLICDIGASDIAALQRKRLAGPNFSDVRELERKILAFISEWNEISHPFNWTRASFDKILSKCQSSRAAA